MVIHTAASKKATGSITTASTSENDSESMPPLIQFSENGERKGHHKVSRRASLSGDGGATRSATKSSKSGGSGGKQSSTRKGGLGSKKPSKKSSSSKKEDALSSSDHDQQHHMKDDTTNSTGTGQPRRDSRRPRSTSRSRHKRVAQAHAAAQQQQQQQETNNNADSDDRSLPGPQLGWKDVVHSNKHVKKRPPASAQPPPPPPPSQPPQDAISSALQQQRSAHQRPGLPARDTPEETSWFEVTVQEEEEEEWIEEVIDDKENEEEEEDDDDEDSDIDEDEEEDEFEDFPVDEAAAAALWQSAAERKLSGEIMLGHVMTLRKNNRGDGATHYSALTIDLGDGKNGKNKNGELADEDGTTEMGMCLHRYVRDADWKGLQKALLNLLELQEEHGQHDKGSTLFLRTVSCRHEFTGETAVHAICAKAPTHIALQLLMALHELDLAQQVLTSAVDSFENTVLHTVCAHVVVVAKKKTKAASKKAAKKEKKQRGADGKMRRRSSMGSGTVSKGHHRRSSTTSSSADVGVVPRRQRSRSRSRSRHKRTSLVPEAVLEGSSGNLGNGEDDLDYTESTLQDMTDTTNGSTDERLYLESGMIQEATTNNKEEAQPPALDLTILKNLVLLAPETLQMSNIHGDTPLHLLVTSPGFQSHNKDNKKKNKKKKTAKTSSEEAASMIAVEMAAEEAVISLLNLLPGRDIGAPHSNHQGLTLLHCAIAEGAHERVLVQLLRRLPRAARVPDSRGFLPLHYLGGSSNMGHITWTFCQDLISTYPAALVAQTYEEGDTPLHLLLSSTLEKKQLHDQKQLQRIKKQQKKMLSCRKPGAAVPPPLEPKEFYLDRNTTKLAELLSQCTTAFPPSNEYTSPAPVDTPTCALLVLNKDREQLSPLHCCAQADMPEQLTRLLISPPPAKSSSKSKSTASISSGGSSPLSDRDVAASRASLLQTTTTRSTALHLACSRKSTPACVATVEALATAFPHACAMQDCRGQTPLCVALMNPEVLPCVISTLIHKYEKAVEIPCHGNYLPIHLAIISPSPAINKEPTLRQLLQATSNKRKALEATTVQGDAPLHVACAQPGVPVRVVRLLLEIYPEAIFLTNNDGKLPIDLCRVFNSHLIKSLPQLEVAQSHLGGTASAVPCQSSSNAVAKSSTKMAAQRRGSIGNKQLQTTSPPPPQQQLGQRGASRRRSMGG